MNQIEESLLCEAARLGAIVAMRYFGQKPKQWEKPSGAGLVTEADLAVDSALKAWLLTHRPDYGWLSEESDGSRHQDRVFIIDPIDGTRAFVEGSKDFTISLALAERGRLIAAAVMRPATGECWSASAGAGARLNAQHIRAAAPVPLAAARVLIGRRGLRQLFGDQDAPFKSSFRASVALRLCLVACGRYDAALSPGAMHEWDAAGGALIATEAGCTVTDITGASPRYNQADPRLHGLIAAEPGLASVLAGLALPHLKR